MIPMKSTFPQKGLIMKTMEQTSSILMREDQGINAKTIIRSRYHSQWIFENQLMPLLEMGR